MQQRLTARAWLAYLAAGPPLLAGYYLVGTGESFPHRLAKVALYCVFGLAATAALLLGQRRHLTGRHPAWLLLAASQLVYFCADTTFYVRHDLLGRQDFPSVADLLYGLRYPLLLAALFLLIRRRSGQRDLAGVLDATIVTVAVALLVWVFVVEPGLAPGMSAALQVGLVYQPLLDAAVLALALRFTLGDGQRRPAFYLLIGSLATNLATNCVYGIQQVTGSYSSGSWLDAGWLGASVLLGSCALHPSMTTLSRPSVQGEPAVGRLRLGLLAIATLTAPLTLIAQQQLSGHADVLELALGAAVIFALVLARLSGLLTAARTAAVTDELTGLANRALFLHRLDTALGASRRQGSRVAVLFIDVDRFKMVNDALGHRAGDQLLIEVAARLRSELRDTDLAARHGGDEFTVLTQGLTCAADAWQVAEGLRDRLCEPLLVGGQRVDCSVSIGVAVDLDRSDQPEDLLRHADAALYRAKDAGRNRVELFDQTSRESLKRKVCEEVELRDALESGQISAWIQPVVEMSTGRIVGGEALARWIHPQHGLLMPGRFLPLAIEVGLITTISEEVAAQTMDLREQLGTQVPARFRLSFNLGIGELTLLQIIERAMERVRDRGELAHGLTLEITETAVINDPQAAGRALRQARELGFSVALDDFGTGYSSLSLLRDLPLDSIKIDRSFVQRMGDSPTDAAIVVGVLDLAGRLGLTVVAEGVETEHEVAQLLRFGAVFAQGFRYAPAVPAAQFRQWVLDGPAWLQQPDAAPQPAARAGAGAIPNARPGSGATRDAVPSAGPS